MAGNVPIYMDQGGANLTVGSGGTLTILPGGTFSDTGGTFTPPTNLALTNATVSGTFVAGGASAVTFDNTVLVDTAAVMTVNGDVTCSSSSAVTFNGALTLGGVVHNATQSFNSGPITSTGTAAFVIAVSPALVRVPVADDLSFFATSTTGVTNGSYSISFTTSKTTSISVSATTGLVYQVVANLIS